MATVASGYMPRDTGGIYHTVSGNGGGGGSSTASSCSSNLGFGIATASGSEDHCNVALAGLFQQIMNDMKGSTFAWEDFLTKSSRLHAALKSTLVASSAFLDAFQRVADVATNARGATKEIGKCLTRMVLRQRSIEAKMKTFASALMDCLVTPLQEKMEDWKKTCLYMDKEHAKEYKRCRQEIKKLSTDTVRLQKKAKKAGHSKPINGVQNTNWGTVKPGLFALGSGSSKALDSWNDLLEMKRQLQDKEAEAVRQAMIEERSRFCLFVSCLKPFLDEELSMLSEMMHLEEITDSLMQHSADPFQLPPASLQAVMDVKATSSSTVSSADIMLHDHLSNSNDTYYSSSCSSGSNQWGNYMSPPNSPLQEEPTSPRGSKSSNNHEDINFRDHGEFSVLGQRHGSICSISNASTSSYASSNASSSSYGGNSSNNQDKTLCPAPKTYRRCLSDNVGQEQHYYPSSITSSIIEHDIESEAEDSGSNQDTLLPANHKSRKPRPRRSSLSQSEDLSRHHPLSLAVRNEYYNTIRFSSISSGDSGFISHPDQISSGGISSIDSSQSAQDDLLTPTTQPESDHVGVKLSLGPAAKTKQNGESCAGRLPPVPPFSSVVPTSCSSRSEQVDQRPHTIAYNSHPSMVPSRDDLASYRQGLRTPKRPPLTQETFLPPPPPVSSQMILPKEFRRTCNVSDSHGTAAPPKLHEAVYANSNLLNDTSSLPPPPDHWIDHGMPQGKASPVNGSAGDQRRFSHHGDMDQMNVSMTIRRVKDKREHQVPGSMDAEHADVILRKQNQQDRQLRRHSQQIFAASSITSLNKPPPPPLPVRRTPSLHQSLQDADGDMNLMGRPGEAFLPLKQPETLPPKPNSFKPSSDQHVNMINSLQERLRQNTKITPNVHHPIGVTRAGNNWSGTGSAGGMISLGNNNNGDVRTSILAQIRNGSYYLRKVSPDECRDRSSPFVRR